MENIAYVIIYWDGNHASVSSASIVKIFYDRKSAMRFFDKKVDELKASMRFTSNELLYTLEIPVDYIDEDDLDSFVGKPASSRVADYLVYRDNFKIIRRQVLGRE